MIPRGLMTLVVIAIVVGAVLLGQQRLKQVTASPAGSARNGEVGYSARDAELIETGADGQPLYRLNAKVIRQLPESDQVELEQVNMGYRDEKSSQWALTAEHGSVRQNNEDVKLTGDVRVSGVLPGSLGLATIRTEQLSFNTQTQVATTEDEEPVTLQWSGREVTGVGLMANLKEQRVSLKSRINGRFKP